MSQIFLFGEEKINIPLLKLDVAQLKQHKESSKKKLSAYTISTDELGLDLSLLSEKAVKCIRLLQASGFKAYLVGGCVRDLLLGKSPKDFDVSTDATPNQIVKILPNSRIIGRRFQIVHAIRGNEIIEITTFRNNKVQAKTGVSPKMSNRVSDQSGMLLRDNVFGKSITQDAQRRDFTINALYLDPEQRLIYDYTGGLYDLVKMQIDMIGDPSTRYLEDPVRMIRALRFSAKLGFKITKRTSAPIQKLKENLLEVSNARMYEEVNKIFLTGHGYESFCILREYGIFELLFPGTVELLNNKAYTDFVEYSLKSSDARSAIKKPNMPHFLYSVLLYPVFRQSYYELERENEYSIKPLTLTELTTIAVNDVLNAQYSVTDIPYATTESITSMWRTQIQFDTANEKAAAALSEKGIFRAAFDFLVIRSYFEPYLEPMVTLLRPYYQRAKELALQRMKEKEQRKIAKREKKALKLEKRKKKKATGANASFDDEQYTSKERQEQLRKAKEWRKAMKLDI